MNEEPSPNTIVMVNLVNSARAEGGTVHQLGLMKSWTNRGYQVLFVTPYRPNPVDITREELSSCEFSYSFRRLGLPALLDTLPQIWTLCRIKFQSDAKALYVRANTLSFILILVARLMGMRVVVEHNSWAASERKVRGGHPLTLAIEKRFQIWAAHAAHVSRCVTPGIARLLAEAGVPKRKLVILGNGTDLHQFFPLDRNEALAAFALDTNKTWLGFLGLMSPWQGTETILHALSRLDEIPDLGLILAGDGPERMRLEALTSELGLQDRVVFIGHVRRQKANLIINCFDIALAPFSRARNSEIGLSAIKIRNYAAAGRTVIASDIEGTRELSNQGWLFLHEPDDAEDLATVIRRVLNDSDRAKDRAVMARRYAEDNFRWDDVAENLLEHLFPN